MAIFAPFIYFKLMYKLKEKGMKKLLFSSLFFIATALFISSCINTDLTGNMSTSGAHPALVNQNINTGTLSLLSSFYDADILIPAEIAAELQAGQCLMADLTMDWDDQPDSRYFTAKMVSYKTVEQNLIYFQDSINVGAYNSPLEGVSFSYRPILKSKYFFQIYHKGMEKRTVNYALYASRDSIDAETGAANLYLVSQRDTTTTAIISQIHAFDMEPLLQELGKDTVLSAGGEDITLRHINFNVNYLEKEEDGVPVFKRANDQPLEIFIEK
jgi:hypothetical protein